MSDLSFLCQYEWASSQKYWCHCSQWPCSADIPIIILLIVSLHTSTCNLLISLECPPMVRKTWVQSQVASYQRLLKWYLIPPCLTFSNIRYVSSVKWSNPGKEVAPSPTPRCRSYWKGSLLVALDYDRQLDLLTDELHGPNPKSPRFSWTLLGILTNLSSAMVRTVSTLPQIFKSPDSFSGSFGLFQSFQLLLISLSKFSIPYQFFAFG